MVKPADSVERPSKTATSPAQEANSASPGLHELQLQLLQKLQTTLDLNELLAQFFDVMKGYMRISGLTYSFEEAKLVCNLGINRKHSAGYNISSGDQQLGQLTFSREHRFAEAELAALEILISSLFHPLRNALLYRQAVESSMRDPLTNVGNRMALSQALTREVELAKRFHRPFSLMLIDVDHFKSINDSIGHSAGDAVLQHLAKKLCASLRQIDEVFRYGGEEFVVVLSNTNDQASLLVAERLRQAMLQDPPLIEGEPIRLTVSIGLSIYQSNDSEDSLFERADEALYKAKHSGRNCVVCGSALPGTPD